MKSKKITIAYGLCGEGFGHYGRSIGILKLLATENPDIQIDVYTYGYSLRILSIDEHLPQNISVNKIPGFLFKHSKSGKVSIMGTFINLNNDLHTIKLLLINFATPFILFFSKIFGFNTDNVFNKYIKYFDFAITDFEAMLPRIARVRKKNFLMIDSLHILVFSNLKGVKFTLKENFKFVLNRIFAKLYHPLPKTSLLTTLYNFSIRKKYKSKVKLVGPLIRRDIAKLESVATYGDYYLVYLRKSIRKKILPIFAKYSGVKFVVFTEDVASEEVTKYKTKWIEFLEIDPKNFVNYLAKCKAVISTSGYTLICEALNLKKPFFGIKIGGILGFEQRLSLLSLQKLKLGNGCKINKFNKNLLKHFIKNTNKYIDNFKHTEIKDDTQNVVELMIEELNKSIPTKNKITIKR